VRPVLNSIYILTIAAGFTPAFGQVTLMASPNPATLGAPVALQASVPGGVGKVTFFDGVTPLGTRALAGGQATLNTRLLPAGTRTLKAIHIGSFGSANSVSPPINITINAKALTGSAWVQGSRIAVGGPPLASAIADVNNDGIPDFGTVAGTSVAVGLGKGDGSILPPVIFSTTAANTPVALALADFNLDGKSDAAVHANSPGAFCLALGNGQGGFTFAPNNCSSLQALPNSGAAADFNGDGLPDIAIATSSGVVVFLGNGDGTFHPPTTLLSGADTRFIAAADFRGNGTADLVFVSGSNVVVMLGNGDGTFQAAINAPGGNGMMALVVGNFKPGKFPDVAVLNSLPANNPPISRIFVLLGNGDGTLQPGIAEAITAVVNPVALAVGDFNGDGKLDLVVTADGSGQNPSPPFIQVGYGAGDGTFMSGGFTVTSVMLTHPTSVAVAELNGDGLPDLVIASQNSNEMVVLLGTAPGGVPMLAVSPGSLSFTGFPGLPAPPSATLSVTSGGTPVGFTVAPVGGSWLSASASSSTTPAQVRVSVDPSNLSPGPYNGSVAISSPSTNPTSVNVPVTLTVPQPGTLVNLPTSLPPFMASGPGGNALSQVIPLFTTNNTQVAFTAAVSPANSFLTISPVSGGAPSLVTVTATPGGMPAGSYPGSITITTASQQFVVAVTLVIPAQQPVSLNLIPLKPQITVRAHVNFTVSQQLLIANGGGGGSQKFQIAIPNQPSWLTVSPNSGTVPATGPAPVQIAVDPRALDPGTYQVELQVTLGALAPRSVTLTVVVTGAQRAVLSLGVAGVSFTARKGEGLTVTQTVPVLDVGDKALTWQAKVISDWLVLNDTSLTPGSASRTVPGQLTLSVNPAFAATAPAGTYYASATVTAQDAVSGQPADNSGLLVTAVLQVVDGNSANGGPVPIPDPAGLIFRAQKGTSPMSQPVQVSVSSAKALNFQVFWHSETPAGSPPVPVNWLSAIPLSGTVSTSAPATVMVSADTTGLNPGVYKGGVTVALGNELRTVSVTLIVTAGAPAGALPGNAAQPQADACTAQQLAVIIESPLPDGFSSFVAGPQFIVAQVSDDCGKSITDPNADPLTVDAQPASVVISFDTGDPSSKVMEPLNGFPGLYGTTWTPTSTGPTGITVTATHAGLTTGLPGENSPSRASARAAAGSLPTGVARISGKVLPGADLTRTGVLSHIAAGGGWITVITLVNNSSAAVPVTVALHSDNGSALPLLLTTTLQGVTQVATTATVSAVVSPNATLLISMGDQIPVTVVGWVDVLSAGPLGGFAIFRYTPQSGSPSEGTVPLQTQFPSSITLPYDNTAGFVMGVALANLSTSSANVTATVWDDRGIQLGSQVIAIPGSGHTAFVLPDKIGLTAGKRGIVIFQSSGGIAGLGLRFSPAFTFTSIPTILPGMAVARSGLSQIAAGGGWITVITLVNTSSAAVPVTVAFHSDDGSALPLLLTTTLQGVTKVATTSSVNAVVNPNATLLISTGDQIPATVVGWADVSGPLGGFGIFRYTPQSGSPSEGTVPLQTQIPSSITLPYDNTAGFVMGVALANLSTSSRDVTATTWDDKGVQLGSQAIKIPGSGHTAFVLPDKIGLTAGKRGFVTFQSSTPDGIAGLGLRFSPAFTFTSLPTL
jgi:hypothetical protein